MPAQVNIQVRYFASLRERMGCAEVSVSINAGASVADVWARVSADREVPGTVLAAVNQAYESFDYLLNDGDELAFFPPVTGG